MFFIVFQPSPSSKHPHNFELRKLPDQTLEWFVQSFHSVIFSSFRDQHLNQNHVDPKAWKAGNHPIGDDVRAYSPEPPTSEGTEIDLGDFAFKLVQVSIDNRKTGWSKFSFKLPQTVRAMYHNDVVYGSDWRGLMKDFDDRFLNCLMNNL